MGRIIRCIRCNFYLGEIEKARLHKDIKFLCIDCNIKRVASDMKKGNAPIDMPDFFEGIFGGKKGKE